MRIWRSCVRLISQSDRSGGQPDHDDTRLRQFFSRRARRVLSSRCATSLTRPPPLSPHTSRTCTPPIAHRPRWAPNRGKAGLIRRRTAEPLPQRRRARLCAADLICSHRPASLAPSRSHLMTHHISPLLVLLFVCTLPILRAQSVTVTIDDSTGGEYHVHPIGAVFTIKVLTRAVAFVKSCVRLVCA